MSLARHLFFFFLQVFLLMESVIVLKASNHGVNVICPNNNKGWLVKITKKEKKMMRDKNSCKLRFIDSKPFKPVRVFVIIF
jgi:hypothetical protein